MRFLAGVATLVMAALPLRAEDMVTDFRLENGMQVVVIEDHRAPVVMHMVWYRAGAADETPGVRAWRISLSTSCSRARKPLSRASFRPPLPPMAGGTMRYEL